MRRKLRTSVIDYSDTQRKILCYLASKNSHLELINGYKKASTAISTLINSQPDLIIADVDTPDINDFNFLTKLPDHTQLIIVTANPDYAFRAFELGATDFLLKPVQPARFHVAIRKACLNQDTADAIKDSPSLQFRSDYEMKKIALADIRWIEAVGDYVKIVTRTEHFLIHSTMKSIEEALPGDTFLRIHRSYIVNLNKVENFSHTNVEIEGNELPMSRKRKTKLEEVLQPYE